MKVEYNNTNNYIIVTPEDGYVLTNWYKDKDDILDYSSSVIMYTPMNYDTSYIYEVSIEDDEMYIEQQRIKIEEMEKGGN